MSFSMCIFDMYFPNCIVRVLFFRIVFPDVYFPICFQNFIFPICIVRNTIVDFPFPNCTFRVAFSDVSYAISIYSICFSSAFLFVFQIGIICCVFSVSWFANCISQSVFPRIEFVRFVFSVFDCPNSVFRCVLCVELFRFLT